MSFKSPHKHGASGSRENYDYMGIKISRGDWSRVIDASNEHPDNRLGIFVAGALLWFASLDREKHLRIAVEHDAEKHGLHRVNISRWVGEDVRGWHFPHLSMCTVVGAAVVHFLRLSADQRWPWILSVYVGPVGVLHGPMSSYHDPDVARQRGPLP